MNEEEVAKRWADLPEYVDVILECGHQCRCHKVSTFAHPDDKLWCKICISVVHLHSAFRERLTAIHQTDTQQLDT